jgi:glycosyltransferase involved in cell wall biosynthesis
MIFFVMPCNSVTGWGLCATNLSKELLRHEKIRYVSNEILNDAAPKEALDAAFFKTIQYSDFEFLKTQKQYPVVQALQHDLSEYMGTLSGSVKIGICFSDRKIPKELVKNAKSFNHIVAGSKWSQNLLKEQGVDSVVIYQGIDPKLFNISRKEKNLFKDDFVVFSGCKFEQRKGQDVFIKAYKIFQDKYPETRLITSWYNPYTKDTGENILVQNGIDMRRATCLPLVLNACLPAVYQNTDVGVFPSRCEAGTNLVMTEYMACGKPVIATIGTGQGDLVDETTGFIIKSSGGCNLYENNECVSVWEEPCVESILQNLEFVYANPSKVKKIAKKGSDLVSKLTWRFMAENLLELVKKAG